MSHWRSTNSGPPLSPVLARALDYPYVRPDTSFVCGGGGWSPASDAEIIARSEGRTAVVACGSNASPLQLQRKFAGTVGAVPVLRTGIVGFDAVYAAQVTSYGAIPCTLLASAGTTVMAAVTFLTDDQLAIMDATEVLGIDYERTTLDAELAAELTGEPLTLQVYASVTGLVHDNDGSAIALSAVDAQHRRLPSATQQEMLTRVANAFDMSVESLVTTMVATPRLHDEVEAFLRS